MVTGEHTFAPVRGRPLRRPRRRWSAAAAGGKRPTVLVAGGGVAGLEFLLRLAELAPECAAVEILSPDRTLRYRPFAVAETFGIGPAFQLELEQIATDAGATFHL